VNALKNAPRGRLGGSDVRVQARSGLRRVRHRRRRGDRARRQPRRKAAADEPGRPREPRRGRPRTGCRAGKGRSARRSPRQKIPAAHLGLPAGAVALRLPVAGSHAQGIASFTPELSARSKTGLALAQCSPNETICGGSDFPGKASANANVFRRTLRAEPS